MEDVAFRVIAALEQPDHATIARFVAGHQRALADLFGEVLTMCARRGLAKVGVIAVDGTNVQANASRNENLDYEQIAREIIEQAIATDQAEDELYGAARGDELPEEWQTGQGRRKWLAEAKRRLEAERATHPEPVARERPKRLKQAKRRLDAELTEDVIHRVSQALRTGNFVKPACELAGISVASYYGWRECGEADHEAGIHSPYVEFLEPTTRAIAEGEMLAVAQLAQNVRNGDQRAIEFYLERRHGESGWARQDRMALDHSGRIRSEVTEVPSDEERLTEVAQILGQVGALPDRKAS